MSKLRTTKPKYVEKIWGGRSLKRLFNKPIPTGKHIGESWELYDKNIPVVVKLIDVKEPLSIQVHPRGKSELWYVLEAGRGAMAMGGINLHEYRIKKGTWIYLPYGTIHTILPPAVLLEVSQNKLITYRLFDWGRKRGKLDMKQGLKAIDVNKRPEVYNNKKLFKCPYFAVELIRLNAGAIKNTEKNIYFINKGRINADGSIFKKGDTFLLSKNCNMKILSQSEIFRIFNWG